MTHTDGFKKFKAVVLSYLYKKYIKLIALI